MLSSSFLSYIFSFSLNVSCCLLHVLGKGGGGEVSVLCVLSRYDIKKIFERLGLSSTYNFMHQFSFILKVVLHHYDLTLYTQKHSLIILTSSKYLCTKSLGEVRPIHQMPSIS